MSKLWELSQYVEEHPDAHQHRWRLAKKLYATWEYRLALEHLQILCNELEDEATPNLYRYLTATYYRLARYDECLKTLDDAISRWPDEVGLLEQKAKTLKSLKRYREAAAVWEAVHELDPDHSVAKSAARALHKTAGAEEREEFPDAPELEIDKRMEALLDLTDMDCPECGAPNNQESQACWRCGRKFGEPLEEPGFLERVQRQIPDIPWRIVAGVVILAMSALSIYMSLPAPPPDASPQVDTAFRDLWIRDFGVERMILGISLLIGWPLAFYFSGMVTILKNDPDPVNCVLAGMLLALATYLCLWIPSPWFWALTIVPGVILGGIFSFTAFDLRGVLAAAHWALHIVLVGLVLAVFVSIAWGPSSLLSPIGLYKLSGLPESSRSISDSGTLDRQNTVRWKSSGSNWLDRQIGQGAIEVRAGEEVVSLELGLYGPNGEIVAFESTDKEELYVESRQIQQGVEYRLRVLTEPSVSGTVKIWGMLPVTVSDSDTP